MVSLRTHVSRYVTAAVVMIACGWTAAQGLAFVRFESALQRGDAHQWSNTPGVASLALDAALGAMADRSGTDALRGREELLTQLLGNKAGASRHWLALAAVRRLLARPQDTIDAAFLMSGLTGPVEGAVMAERSLFGVLQWEQSSAAAHTRTVTDLCGLTVFDPWQIRLVMTTKAEAVRTELRASLEAGGCSPALIKTVGL